MSGAIEIDGVTKRYGRVAAIAAVSATIQRGCLTGLVGPDGAGKTTLMRLMAGLLLPDEGRISIGGNDSIRDAEKIRLETGYMPQRFGLYEDLTVLENLELYARLRGLSGSGRGDTFDRLFEFTRLREFSGRLAGRLSGGMKQKLGLACALMARPEVLLLDEPSVGVDPLSRRELWTMVQALADDGMAVVWSTAYLDEAEQCQEVLLLNEGALAFCGPPQHLTRRVRSRSYQMVGIAGDRRDVLSKTLELGSVRDGVIQGEALRVLLADESDTSDLKALAAQAQAELQTVEPRFEDAFIDLLGGGPGGRSAIAEKMQPVALSSEIAVSCRDLTKRFGSFTATESVTFDVHRAEVFGLLGPNGAGKSTTFKMLCGLLKPTSGEAHVVGLDLRKATGAAKQQVGYMAQKFSLYGLLSVKQNLNFFAGIYQLTGATRRQRIDEMIETFELEPFLDRAPANLPLGFKQRLALACALMHRPAVLFLDEPTSGVDPITRREFWTHINGLVGKGVTVMVTTHFMDEAEYCDRVAMIHQARLIAVATPDELKSGCATQSNPFPTMEDAFVTMIEAAERVGEAEAA